MKKIKKVSKRDYEVYDFINGYFGICKKGTFGGGCVAGGDSGNEDDYNESYITLLYNKWDGTLYLHERYGYIIFE